jgi:hypothetical protein
VAVAAQGLVVETMVRAQLLGIVAPPLIGKPAEIRALCEKAGPRNAADWVTSTEPNGVSEVAGDAAILLVAKLVAGNILAKNLKNLASAVAAGVALDLFAPVVMTSRADPAPEQLACPALAVLIHHQGSRRPHSGSTHRSSLRPTAGGRLPPDGMVIPAMRITRRQLSNSCS